jgi:maltokinase
VAERLTLDTDHEVVLEPQPDGWAVRPQRRDGSLAAPGDGAAEALLATIRQESALADDWQVLRLAPVPDVTGERAIGVDQTNTSVIVGDRVVVKWLRAVADDPQPSLAALAQLSAVGFEQMPTPYAVLTWTSPTGRALPVAYVSEHLAGAVDGWTWCVDLVRGLATGATSDGWARDFPGRLGTLAGELHVALATPNHVFPHPVQVAGAARVQRWYDGAYAMLESALHVSDEESVAVVAERATAIAAAFDACLGDEDRLARTPVQHIHGDLHVGQVLRRGEELSLIDFDGNPVAPSHGGVVHPAARDVAQLATSLEHVGHVVLHRTAEADAGVVHTWLATARDDLLTAYRTALQDHAMSSLLDESLLPAFELEQELRELVYADRHLPEWAYAPQAALREKLPATGS